MAGALRAFLQSGSGVAIPVEGGSQQPSRDQHAPDRPLTLPEAQAQLRAIHVTRVERHFGDWWGVCACGARSREMVLRSDAEHWQCPRLQVEEDLLFTRSEWHRRVADASFAGVVR